MAAEIALPSRSLCLSSTILSACGAERGTPGKGTAQHLIHDWRTLDRHLQQTSHHAAHRCAPRRPSSPSLFLLLRTPLASHTLSEITGSRPRAPFAGNLSTLGYAEKAWLLDFGHGKDGTSSSQQTAGFNIDRHGLCTLAFIVLHFSYSIT